MRAPFSRYFRVGKGARMSSYFLLQTLILSTVVQISQGFLLNKKVCYSSVGCFSNSHPFDNALDAVPDSPEKINIKFYLYTRQNHHESHILNATDKASVVESSFDAEKETKIVIHGYMASHDEDVFKNLTDALLKKGDFNVIGVDWRGGAHQEYQKSVANTRVVGAVTANFIQWLHNTFRLALDNVHLIGHSLGAQTAGYCGRRVSKIGRITGLDPAGPLYTGTDVRVRLDPSDARFVDVIHTNGAPLQDMGFGTPDSVGHIDFFPNGGKHQPGCPPPVKSGVDDLIGFHFDKAFTAVGCSHTRSIQLLTASLLDTDCKFEAYPCQSWQDFENGRCSNCGNQLCPVMGYDAVNSQQSRGSFYLRTSATYPYCIT